MAPSWQACYTLRQSGRLLLIFCIKRGLLMWKILSTAHSSVWLCLLGSGLSLIAFFFLPYATSTSETLGECLTSCALDRGYPSSSFRFQPVPWGIGALLLLLLGIIVLAFLALPLRSLRWKSTTLYLRLTSIALSYYLGAVCNHHLLWLGHCNHAFRWGNPPGPAQFVGYWRVVSTGRSQPGAAWWHFPEAVGNKDQRTTHSCA